MSKTDRSGAPPQYHSPLIANANIPILPKQWRWPSGVISDPHWSDQRHSSVFVKWETAARETVGLGQLPGANHKWTKPRAKTLAQKGQKKSQVVRKTTRQWANTPRYDRPFHWAKLSHCRTKSPTKWAKNIAVIMSYLPPMSGCLSKYYVWWGFVLFVTKL